MLLGKAYEARPIDISYKVATYTVGRTVDHIDRYDHKISRFLTLGPSIGLVKKEVLE